MNTLIDLIKSFKNNNDPALIYYNGYRRFVFSYDSLYNFALRTADYLKTKGIAANRVSFKGYGKRNPIASNETKDGRRKNQRVDIKILDF